MLTNKEYLAVSNKHDRWSVFQNLASVPIKLVSQTNRNSIVAKPKNQMQSILDPATSMFGLNGAAYNDAWFDPFKEGFPVD